MLLDVARRIGTAVEALRAAASAAANHRSRSDLAADVGTKITAVFPRQARQPEPQVRLTPPPVGPPQPDEAEHHAAI